MSRVTMMHGPNGAPNHPMGPPPPVSPWQREDQLSGTGMVSDVARTALEATQACKETLRRR